MKNQGQILATMGGTKAAVVAWDSMTRDEIIDALDVVLHFLEGIHKDGFTEAGLRTAKNVYVRLAGEISDHDFPDPDSEI